MHYYQFHIGDYAAHTRHLSLMEDLAYRRLLDLYYLHQKPIIAEIAARQIGMKEYGQDVLAVLIEFFVETQEGYVNLRADREILNYIKQVDGGKKGAEKRWAKPSHTPPIATTLPPPIATINQEPLTNNQDKQLLSDKSDVPDNFAQLWKAYPKKVGKSETLKAWKAMKINGEFPKILEALERQKLSKKWKEGFILDPVRWVKGKRWEDVVEVEPDFLSMLSDENTPIDCGDSWKESASGITVKGRSLGIEQQTGEPFPMFKIRVIEAEMMKSA